MTASSNDAARSLTGETDDPEVVGAVLSLDPPIVYTSMGWPDRMGWINAYAASLREGPAAFLIYQTWHFADNLAGKFVIANLRRYRRTHPRHTLIMLCNAPDEVETLSRFGEEALLLNHNLTVSEAVFRPLPGAEIEFDAIYSARPAREKRIELAAAIERVAYICYVPVKLDGEGAQVLAGIHARAPTHAILNRLEDGRPIPLRAGEVNQTYSRAAVGLCLSEVEGAMMSSIEYLLAGLPIVSTPSRGGRDFFFDPEYCLIVPPEPRAVRDGVAALKARQVPRDYVRQKTLAKIEPQRRAFLALLDGLLERHGHAPRFGTEWPWLHHRSLCGTRTVSEQFAKARAEATSRPHPDPA